MNLPPVTTRGAGIYKPGAGAASWRLPGELGVCEGRHHPGRSARRARAGVDEAGAPALPSEKPSLPPSGALCSGSKTGALLAPEDSHSEAVPAPSGASTPALQILSACSGHT